MHLARPPRTTSRCVASLRSPIAARLPACGLRPAMVRRLLLSLRWRHLCLPLVVSRLTLRDCFALRGVSRECRRLVDAHFATLKTLKIACDNTFRTSAFKILHSCKRIKILKLPRCHFLTDKLLIPLLKGNTNLTYLNLSYTPNITARSLQPVILNCPNLRILRLVRCSWLTSGAIEALALHQSRLEEVDFSYCSAVSEGSLVIFLKKFRHLRIVSLQGIQGVTDRCLLVMYKFSTMLEYLNTAECHRITPAVNQAVKMLLDRRRIERTHNYCGCCQLLFKNCNCNKSAVL